MLEITVPGGELWDSKTEMFYQTPETTLKLEHSLVSISKWEAAWQKPFLETTSKTRTELLSYAKCMTLTQHVDDKVYIAMTAENIKAIDQYVNMERTATKIYSRGNGGGGINTVPTSERIYSWMIQNQIPFDPCQKWHLSRLLALIRLCELQNTEQPRMSPREQAEFNRALNAKRRAQLHSRG